LDSALPHSGVGPFFYSVDEGPGYPIPMFQMDTTGYKYHTYAMEFLPHECEFLVDGAVILRFPDRMVPPGDIRYDYVTSYPRASLPIIPGELEMQNTPFAEAYFRNNVGSCLGCWDNAAHLRIDYVKVWDVPADIKIPDFPK
ncbi:MAG TPA: hypothetical protein VFX22_04185, partial [Candidatus Kapabacteria bacterium]|nr:hypothetical protein [Candidatus Kapabacteria bacterium]